MPYDAAKDAAVATWAGVEQARQAVVAARQAVDIARYSTIINALVIIVALATPLFQEFMERRRSRREEGNHLSATRDLKNRLHENALDVADFYSGNVAPGDTMYSHLRQYINSMKRNLSKTLYRIDLLDQKSPLSLENLDALAELREWHDVLSEIVEYFLERPQDTYETSDESSDWSVMDLVELRSNHNKLVEIVKETAAEGMEDQALANMSEWHLPDDQIAKMNDLAKELWPEDYDPSTGEELRDEQGRYPIEVANEAFMALSPEQRAKFLDEEEARRLASDD